ncbi:VirB8 family type IV secretion system protein [Lysobacter humi (ex Lee et al. 2017)]
MGTKKIKDSAQVEHAVGRAVNYEVTVADMARRSERRAWRVAGASTVMSLILAGGYFYMLPLKQKVPYLVMADASSGTATVARLTGDLGKTSIARSEAIHRSNVAHYIQAREAYDLALLKLRDWTVVYTMSAPEVARSYTAANSSQNPESPFNLYRNDKAIRVQINSIQMIGGEDGAMPKGATVRFQRTRYDKTNGWTDFLDNRIATLTFTYKDLALDEKQRIENPLGFQVTSYRVDRDYSSTPPPATPRPTTAAVAMPGQPAGADMLPAAMQAPPVQPGMPAQPGAAPVAAPGTAAAPATVPPATLPSTAQGAAPR